MGITGRTSFGAAAKIGHLARRPLLVWGSGGGNNSWSNSCADEQECGHYTQIVWRTRRRIGCARVFFLGGRGGFMTCNYDPPGNYIGERPY